MPEMAILSHPYPPPPYFHDWSFTKCFIPGLEGHSSPHSSVMLLRKQVLGTH